MEMISQATKTLANTPDSDSAAQRQLKQGEMTTMSPTSKSNCSTPVIVLPVSIQSVKSFEIHRAH